jgi:hypothetical protein
MAWQIRSKVSAKSIHYIRDFGPGIPTRVTNAPLSAVLSFWEKRLLFGTVKLIKRLLVNLSFPPATGPTAL